MSEVLDRSVAETEGNEVGIEELPTALQGRPFGPPPAVPALIAVAPAGAIPGMSPATGGLNMLPSVQIPISQTRLWVREGVLRFSFPRDTLESTAERVVPWIERVERDPGRRPECLARSPLAYRTAVTGMAMGLLSIHLPRCPSRPPFPATPSRGRVSG